MKRMLFNATQQEELRVAIVDGQRLIDIDIESTGRELHKSNIYKAVITRIEPSLEACFVNYGEERHGFLPFKEVARQLFKEGVEFKSATIKDALTEGQEIMVQVEKEERGNKGAALTTFISLAGRYLVLMPNNPRGGGVSRRVEGEERQELREIMDQLDVPRGMSIIGRTAGIGRSLEELQWDLNYLLQLWKAIESAGTSSPGAFLIYHESSLVIRAIRDYFTPDIGEILIDTDEIYEQACQFMSYVMPDMVNRVKRYKDSVPLFSRFQIEHQIESAYSRVVSLPSGGSIVIDHTEALVAIDVNSARSTRGTDIETTAFTTNCEAAEEVARQLRLRDLGGLIVIDFIDMELAKNRREIENKIREALRYDRARVQMEKITRFGLLELSRQRLRPSLSEGIHITCPRCNGTGHIRDTDSSALQVLRVIEEEAIKENTAVIHVQVPVDVAAFLLNEKRSEILKVEGRHKVEVVLIPNKYLETPHFNLERIKFDDPRLEEPKMSYKLVTETDKDMGFEKQTHESPKPQQEAKVKNIPEGQLPAPVVEPKENVVAEKEPGFFDKILSIFGVGQKQEPEKTPEVKESQKPSRRNNNRGERKNRRKDRDVKKNVSHNVADTVDEGSHNESNNKRRLEKERQKEKAEIDESLNATSTNEVIADESTATENEDNRRRRRRSNKQRTHRDEDDIQFIQPSTQIIDRDAINDEILAITQSRNEERASYEMADLVLPNVNVSSNNASENNNDETRVRRRSNNRRSNRDKPIEETNTVKQEATAVTEKQEKTVVQTPKVTPLEVNFPENYDRRLSMDDEPKLSPTSSQSVVQEKTKSDSDSLDDLDAILKKAGLTMASTDPTKVLAMQNVEPEKPVKPVRRRRVKVVIDDGPLIQVDTKK